MFPNENHNRPPIPSAKETLGRPRLLDKLALDTHQRVSLIVAPPGYGKTTLAAQLASQLTCPVAWHRLEARERDLPNLCHHALDALEMVAPNINTLTFAPDATPVQQAMQITDYLQAQLSVPVLYVMDDIQYVVGSLAAERWLQTFISHLPQHCHLLLMGQMLPKLSITELIARNELVTIGQQELGFTMEEIRQLAAITGQPVLDPSIAMQLEGWPAGVALAYRPMPAAIAAALLDDAHLPEALFDRLAQTLLNAQPFRIRDVLLVSSTLTGLTPELCTKVLHINSDADLDELDERQLFITKSAQGYMYHSLFRDFLQRQLKREDAPRFYDLHRQAARWFSDQHDWEAAFEHFIAADCFEAAVAITERVAQAYYTQGRIETLLHWESRLRAEDVQAPRLFYTTAGVAIHRYEYDLAREKLAAAHSGFQARHDTLGLIDVQLRYAMLNRLCGNYDQAIQEATQLVDQLTTSPALNGKRGVALNIIGTAHLQLGKVDKALHYLEEALPFYRDHSDADAIAALLQNLEVAYMQRGDFEQVNSCLHELVALQRKLGKSGGLATALNNQGYYFYLLGNYAQARRVFEEGLTIAIQTHSIRAEGYLHWSLGDLDRDLNHCEAALAHYHRGLDITRNQDPFLECAMFNSLSMLYRWQGNLEDALNLAQKAQTLAEKHQLTLEVVKAQANTLLMNAWSWSGDREDVAWQIDQLVSSLDHNQNPIELMQILGQQAIIALLNNRLTDAYRAIETALCLIPGNPICHPLVVEALHAPDLKRLIQRYAQKWPSLDRQLQQLEDLQVPSQPLSQKVTISSRPTYSLRVSTLGQEHLERNGEPISASEWDTTISRQLFLYLLFNGPDTRERISLVFWPDHSPRQTRSNFHSHLHRARQKLGQHVIQFEDDVYLLNPDIDIWCDSYEFEGLIYQAQLGSPHNLYSNDLWQSAVNLYQGEFLPSLTSEWVLPRRQALEDLYLTALLGLSDCAYRQGRYDEALQHASSGVAD